MKIKSMVEIATAAGIPDPTLLLGRLRGKAVFPHLVKAIQDVDEGEYLLLKFTSEQFCDSSFIDETLIELGSKLIHGEFGDRGMALSNLSESVQTSLRSTLAMRRDDARKKNEDFKVVFLLFLNLIPTGLLPKSSWEIVGALEQSLFDVFLQFSTYESISAADVAREFKLEINTASMRLKRLYERHLLRRQYQTLTNGREFVYYFWK